MPEFLPLLSPDSISAIALIWLQFVLCVGVIGVAGVRLSRYCDATAVLTGRSRNWIGLILIATVTSLPELVTGLSAVTVAAAPDIAVGDALGSCVFNLAILALVDLVYRKGAISAFAGSGHVMSAVFGVILLSGVVLAILLSAQGVMPSVGHVSFASVAIVVLYLVAMRALYLTEQRNTGTIVAERPGTRLKAALMGFGVHSAVIVGAGVWLPLSGVELARVMGWSHSFVGTLFVAFATSVPELATTWGAVGIGAIDRAIGNLPGSNLFDVLIPAIDYFAYLPGPISMHVSPLQALSAGAACLMGGVVILAQAYRPVARVWHTASQASLVLPGLCLLDAVALDRHGG